MVEDAIIPVADAAAELPPRATWGVRLMTLIAIIVPLLGLIAVPFFCWGWGFRWTDLGVLVGMYLFTGLGITVGFHRLFVHRSFDTYMWAKFIFAMAGSMAIQGALFQWVGMHRRHHQFSDLPQDPHTPNRRGHGLAAVMKGFWHAHIGWFFDAIPPDLDRYIKDLAHSPALRAANALFPLWIVLSVLIPALLGGVILQSWNGFWTGMMWGGLARIFLVHHVTWSVNSACHLWGLRPFKWRRSEPEQCRVRLPGDGRGLGIMRTMPSRARHAMACAGGNSI